MCKKNQISNIVATLIEEADAAASVLLSETADLDVPNEVIEAAKKTELLIESITAKPPTTAAGLKRYGWQLNIICSELYLNLQRVDNDKKECFFNAINSYKIMMYHYSKAQMPLMQSSMEVLTLDLEHHARILKNIEQKEIRRLAAAKLLEKKAADLLLCEANAITAKLAKALQNSESLAEALGLFGVFIVHLRHYAQLLDDQGCTLLYLAEEYDLFTSKIREI